MLARLLVVCCAVSIAALPAGVRRDRSHEHLAASEFERMDPVQKHRSEARLLKSMQEWKEAAEEVQEMLMRDLQEDEDDLQEDEEEKVVTTLDEADLLKRGEAILAAKREEAAKTEAESCGGLKTCFACMSSYTVLTTRKRIKHFTSPLNTKGRHNCRWWKPVNAERAYCSMWTPDVDDEVKVGGFHPVPNADACSRLPG